MIDFEEERQRISKDLALVRETETRLAAEVDELTVKLTRIRARIASLLAEDQTYATATATRQGGRVQSDLSRMTIREAILTVLTEAKPELVRLRDLESIMAARGKKAAGGISVDLTQMKGGEVLNPRWGYWTVP
jgi:hypothetical protein